MTRARLIGADGAAIYVEAGGTVEMQSGAIQNSGGWNGSGGAVCNRGSFTMSGGTISSCWGNSTSARGGAIRNEAGTFNMSGGTIENCYTQYDGSQGGAVYNFQGATFNMSGGTIAACSSASGGGVYNAGTFNMTGSAQVTGCSGTGIVSTGTTTINGSCWVQSCSGGYGGGIRAEGGVTTIKSCNVHNSTATYGSQLACTGSGKIVIDGGNIDAGDQQNMMGAVFIQTGSTAYGVELKSGDIKNSYASNDSVHSGGVTIYSGSFWMSGGWIYNCRTTASGGAVWVANGLVQMTGGRIYGCSASGNGGAIYSSQYNNTVNISGSAQIDSNTAVNGAGIAGYGTINISGGKILSNTASNNGGGVHFGGGTLTISGGEIYSNWGKGCGGGLRSDNGTINMTGGKIYSNKSPDNGNGIQMHGTATFTMTGGEIYGNFNDGQRADYGGGGILAWDNSKVYIYGGAIRDNSCNGTPGAAILFRGTEMNVYGGLFTGNTTTTGAQVFQRQDGAVGAVNVYGGVYDVSPTAGSYGVTVPTGFAEAQVADAVYTVGRNAVASDGELTKGTYTYEITNAIYTAAGLAVTQDGATVTAETSAMPPLYTIASGDTVEAYLWRDVKANLIAGNDVRLMCDLAITNANEAMNVNNVLSSAIDYDVTLDLNGHSITGYNGTANAGESDRLFIIGGSVPYKLTITDSVGGGSFVGMKQVQGHQGAFAIIGSGHELTLDGVTLTNFTSTVNGGAIYVAGKLTTKGESKIVGCTAGASATSGGGGVFVAADGTFDMQGGVIAGCSANVGSWCGGGGVCSLGTAYIRGTISNCTARCGAGVGARGGNIYLYDGGKIVANYCSSGKSETDFDGAGVLVDGGNFTMSGGYICDNYGPSVRGFTGLVMWSSGNTFTMYGGIVSNNTTTSDIAAKQIGIYNGTAVLNGGLVEQEPTVANVKGNGTSGVYTLPAYQQVGNWYVIGTGIAQDSDSNLTAGTYTFCPTNAEYVAAGLTFAECSKLKANGGTPATWSLVHEHCLCGDGLCDAEGHTHADVEWQAWTSTTALPTTKGNYYLVNDVTLSAVCETAGDVNLCLNGHVVKQSGDNHLILVPRERTVVVTDCGTAVEHAFAVGSDGEPWTLDENGTEILTGGCLTGGRALGSSIPENCGGAVEVLGVFTMYGGNLVGNKAVYGGAIRTDGGVTSGMTLRGVRVCGNVATMDGGGVYPYQCGAFEMTDCVIDHNTTLQWGGGLTFNTDKVDGFVGTVRGCTIVSNKMTGTGNVYGGGVHINAHSTGNVTLEDCEIVGNSAATAGGGIDLYSGTITLKDVTVTGNTSGAKGAVYLHDDTELNLEGETVIADNTVGGAAANLYLEDGKLATISVVSPLTSGAKIGVTTAEKPTEAMPVFVTMANEADMHDFFFSDDTTYFAKNGNGNMVQLGFVTNPTVKDEHGDDHTVEIPTEWKDEYKPSGEEVMDPKKPMENGLPAWQNGILGLDPTNKLARVYADAPQNTSKDKVTIETKNLDTSKVASGYTVKYRLDKKLRGEDVYTKGDKKETSSFDVAIDGDDPTGIYKLNAVIEKDDGTELADSVEAINTVGIVKATNTNKYCIIAVPWNKLAPGENEDIAVSNVIKTANLEEGDKLHVYRHDKSLYDTWTLQPDKTWGSVTTYKIGKDGKVTTDVSSESSATTIARGNGVWLERKNPTSEPYYLYGQHNTNDVEVIVEKGHNLLAAPGITAWNLSNIEGAKSSDKVLVPGAEPKLYTFKDGKWGYYKQITTKRTIGDKELTGVSSVWTTTESTIPAGTGFWLINKSGKVEIK